VAMSNDIDKLTEEAHERDGDDGSNATGSQSGGSAVTWDVVDSGQSDDIENSLTAQGVSDRETTVEADRTESDHHDGEQTPGGGGRGR
jgi:galactokinase